MDNWVRLLVTWLQAFACTDHSGHAGIRAATSTVLFTMRAAMT
jgi:hypothetical protein